MVNPIGDAPIFLALTEQYPQSVRKILARKIAAYGFVLLAASFLLGSITPISSASLFVVEISGGLVLAVTGWNLLNEANDTSSTTQSSDTLEDALQQAFFPLTLPITVGPGCISIAITLGAHLRHQSNPRWEHVFPEHFLAALIGMLLLCFLVMICYSNADRLVRMLGRSGTTILTRLSAFILLAIGVQIMWNGLSSGIPQLFSFLGSN